MSATVDLSSVVRSTATSLGVPPEIALAIAQQESGVTQFDRAGNVIRGTAGEIGIMQLMPATAAALGVNAFDPYDNIKGGVLYLKQQYARFASWPLAIAAYNSGPGAVASGNSIPSASVSYVANVLALAGANIILPSSIATPVSALVLPSLAAGGSSNTGLLILLGLAGVGLYLALS